jgi:MoxR-like ATPase
MMEIKNMKDTKLSSVNEILKTSVDLKPSDVIISDLKWKYLVRSVLYGKNVLMVGPTGCGKTLAAQTVAKVFNRPFFYFNMGSTQDSRSALIGNTHFEKDTGTIFSESTFVRAIQTPNAVILLDEISRAHHDAANIMMTVLDNLQRYLRLDEKKDSEVINVAKGVCFIGTANIGNQYTATRVMDRALMDRFTVKIEMDFLDKQSELNLVVNRFKINPKDHEVFNTISAICEIASHTRDQYRQEDGKITNFVSTRAVCEMAELANDGFNLREIAESAIYPEFSLDGGVDSERVYIKQVVQKYIPAESNANPLMNDPVSAFQPPF